jgi:hypothetical protein
MRGMAPSRRSTIYLDPDLHRALRLKAAESDKSLSDLVNDAIRRDLAEDAEDLEDYRARKREKSVDLESALKDLKRRGKL